MTAVGKPISRVDGRQKVTGTARFAAEYPQKNLAYAHLVLSTVARGRVTAIDATAAEAASGVRAVLTHANAPKMKPTPVFGADGQGAEMTELPVLQTDRIGWHGQPVAVVVADTFEQARHAASLVRATYDSQPPAHDLAREKGKAYTPKTILGEPPEVMIGDAEAALRVAAAAADHAYTTPRYNHNAIEPHATTAAWDGDALTVWDATQNVFGVRKMLADKFAVPEAGVRVLAPFVGGGFGGKGGGWPHVYLCVAAARHVGRPVKLALTREQVYGCVGGRTPTEQRVALGADKDGRLTALIHTGVTTTSTSNEFAEQFTFPARHLYACPNIHLKQRVVRLDVVPPTFMRAPGEMPGLFALESALDELAYELNLDPVELRLRNQPDKDPVKGTPFSSRHSADVYKLGAEKFGWAKRTPKPRSMRDGRFLVGMGMATAFYPVYQFPAAARVRVNADGSAVVQCGTHEMGMGTATAQAQHAADRLGLPVERVRFEYGDTALPLSSVAGGSSTTVSVAAAVAAACDVLKGKLLALVGGDSPLKGAKPDAVAFADGGLALKDDPAKAERFQGLLKRAGKEAVEADAKTGPGDAAKKLSMGSYGAQFCEVRVDPDLGEVRVTRFVGAFDCGKILNPKTTRSQFLGGIVMGLGSALLEHTRLDPRTARVVNQNLAEYLIPTHADVPAVEAYWLDRPDPHTPAGAHGVGEIGITGVAAAVANAVYHATGERVRDLPITPDKLL